MILIVDAFNTLYASYHALASQLSAPPATAAMYGFFQTILGRLRNCPQYTYVFLCMDSGTTNFRHELFPDYKANRQEYKDVKEQLEKEAIRSGITEALNMLRGLQPHMPWYHVERPNTEGDDLIAKLCLTYPDTPKQIVSGDKDMLQLVNPYTTVYQRGKDRTVEAHTFEQSVGIKFTRTQNKVKSTHKKFFRNGHEWFIFRVLTGDPSDNIPGIKGIGDVGGHAIVRTLMDKFNGSVQMLLDHPEKVLAAAQVRNWKKIAGTIRVSGKQIIQRNISLMSLVEAADRIDTIDPYVWTGNWQTGKGHLAQFLMTHDFKSIMTDMHLFDEMAMKQGG